MLSLLILAALRKAMNGRCDGSPQLRYFSGEDFGVSTSPFSFTYKKCLLRGERYFLPNRPCKGVVVFFHGLGAGHTAYSQEMAFFAKHGYLVYGYDYLGCMTSEGKGIGFLCESLGAQEAFFSFLDQDEAAKGLDRYAVGHSWGGYTALAACREQFNVKAIVSIAGFTSAVDMVCSREKRLEKFRSFVTRAIRIGYGSFAAKDMTEALATSHARVLYLQGSADTMVEPKYGYERIKAAFPEQGRISYKLIPDSAHNPYWTRRAQLYSMELGRDHGIARRDFDNQYEVDYAKLNEDDPLFMQTILDFLEDVDKPATGE